MTASAVITMATTGSNNAGQGGSFKPGSTGSKGTSTHYANDYGVRFSLVNVSDATNGKIIGHSVDFYNIDKGELSKKNVIHSINGGTKLQYIRGRLKFALNDRNYVDSQGGHAYHYDKIWKVYGSGAASKKAKKDWILNKKHAKKLMKCLGVTKEQFKDKNNRLVIEPVCYFFMEGRYYGLTPTEIGLFDYQLSKGGKMDGFESNRSIRSHQGGWTHHVVPISNYLQKSKWGIDAPTGSLIRSGVRYTDAQMINTMGIGYFHFLGKKDKPKIVDIGTYDYIYRCDTDVFTSVELTLSSEANPDSPLNVDFVIPGIGTITAGNIYCPKGYKQLVWVKWHTPKEPTDMIIFVGGNKGAGAEIKVRVEEKTPWEPHNPVADDTRPLDLDEFQMNADISKSKYAKITEKKKTVWSRWEIVEYQPQGDFKEWKEIRHYNTSTYEDIWDEDPYWSFGEHEYATSTAPDGSSVTYVVNGRTPTSPRYYEAKLKKLEMKVHPAKTCEKQNPDKSIIKSGYGIEADITSEIYSNESSNVTGFQTSKYLFPEFNYKKYWRLGDKTEENRANKNINSKIQLPKNLYSYTGYFGYTDGRYHFLPIWYPDGNYKVYAKVYDCWTPTGELRGKVTADITCKGAMWDDWHIQIVK